MTQVQETSSFMDNLLGFLNDEEAEVVGVTENEGFRIETTDQANYFARKLREVRQEIGEAEAAAQQQLEMYQERVEKWLASVTSPLVNEEERLLSLLENFAEEKLEGSTKKSIKLIEGTLQFRKQAPKYEYEDKTLLAYVQTEAPDYLKIKQVESVDKAELKKQITLKQGVPFLGDKEVHGLTVTELPDAFDVK